MKTQTKIKNGYNYLNELCSFNADFNASTPSVNPITNRVQYIIHQLEALNITHELDMYNSKNAFIDEIKAEDTKYINVMVRFNSTLNPTSDTIVFLAHHDVVNLNSENCQDNTASVSNLLHLCSLLKLKQENNTLESNVVVCFTDAEESVSFDSKYGRSGSVRLGHRITKGDLGKVKYAINLELTAMGKNLWICPYIPKEQENIVTKDILNIDSNVKTYRVPPNDSIALVLQGIQGVCIGTLDDENSKQANEKGFCSTWMLCHREADKFENAIESDMTNLVDNLLIRLV